MSEILRDPMWQFIIGTIFALVAIIVPIAVYLKQRRRRSLSYDIISQTPLLRVNGTIKDKLQITYDGKPVQQVHLIIVKLLNSGDTPIMSNDFKKPIRLDYGSNSEVFTAEIQKKEPENVEAYIVVEKNGIILGPTLLNQGDSITIKALVTRFEKVLVDGRIVGVRQIRELQSQSRPYIMAALGIFTAVNYVALIGMVLAGGAADNPFSYIIILCLSVIYGGLAISRKFRRFLTRSR